LHIQADLHHKGFLMKRHVFLSSIALTCVMSGCATLTGESAADADARKHLDLARSLEASSALREAADEYSIIAEQFPASSAYPTAVRKAALLYARPDNPDRNDSLARFWFHAYQELPLQGQEKDLLGVVAMLYRQVDSLSADNSHRQSAVDSLTASSRRQAGTATAQAKRVRELEGELERAVEELKKLKEIDVQLSKSRRKR